MDASSLSAQVRETLERAMSPRLAPRPPAGHTLGEPAEPLRDRALLTPGEWRSALALAEALIPGRGPIRRADETTLAEVEALLAHTFAGLEHVWGKAAQAFDHLAIVRTGRRLRDLDHAAQQALLERWELDPVLGPALQAFALPLRMSHFDRREVYEGLGGKLNVVKNLEQPRWLEQIVDASTLEADDEVECEVVVVGTGAGGAVVGRELAERGYAVVFVEEGAHVRRDRFNGSSMRAHREFYRGGLSAGNTPMPIFMGRLVGGSTAVNGGTSFRTPPWVLSRWCEETGSSDFEEGAMERHFARVEANIGVTPADRRFIGPIQHVFGRGCDALGWKHFAIRRNAPGCEGSGFCDFGCRTDARRSTNLSYVPPALERGGMLYTNLRAERLLLEGGRAVGLEGTSKNGRRVRVRARAVILAGGALPTPIFLQRQGLCGTSGQLGRNLTLHPSGGLSALMPEAIRGWESIPQGYGCDEFLREGILLTAAQPDLNYAPILFPVLGDRLMTMMELMPWLASFGILIADQTKGHVLTEADGAVVVRYDLSQADVDRYHRGLLRMIDIVRAAGARRVYPSVYGGFHALETERDFRRFRDAKLAARHLPLTSYHPLGTAKMGRDPRTSVVGLDHETHDVPGLFIVDGSTVSGPLGVNPQLTIMAVATRAAEKIAERLA